MCAAAVTSPIATSATRHAVISMSRSQPLTSTCPPLLATARTASAIGARLAGGIFCPRRSRNGPASRGSGIVGITSDIAVRSIVRSSLVVGKYVSRCAVAPRNAMSRTATKLSSGTERPLSNDLPTRIGDEPVGSAWRPPCTSVFSTWISGSGTPRKRLAHAIARTAVSVVISGSWRVAGSSRGIAFATRSCSSRAAHAGCARRRARVASSRS